MPVSFCPVFCEGIICQITCQTEVGVSFIEVLQYFFLFYFLQSILNSLFLMHVPGFPSFALSALSCQLGLHEPPCWTGCVLVWTLANPVNNSSPQGLRLGTTLLGAHRNLWAQDLPKHLQCLPEWMEDNVNVNKTEQIIVKCKLLLAVLKDSCLDRRRTRNKSCGPKGLLIFYAAIEQWAN